MKRAWLVAFACVLLFQSLSEGHSADLYRSESESEFTNYTLHQGYEIDCSNWDNYSDCQ